MPKLLLLSIVLALSVFAGGLRAQEDEEKEPAELPVSASCSDEPSCDCSACCGTCCSHCWQGWAQADYVLGSRRGRYVPSLVTDGVLPGATTLFGDTTLGERDSRSGWHMNAGVWLDGCQTVGLGGEFFKLGDERWSFAAASDGLLNSPILARPFFDPLAQVNDALLIAAAGVAENGRVSVSSETGSWSGDLYLRKLHWCCGCARLDMLAGYQFAHIDDRLSVQHAFTAAAGNPAGIPAGTAISGFDAFDARNTYHGAIVGVLGELQSGYWTLRGSAKVGLGGMFEAIDINGQTDVGGVVRAGGLLAQDTNIGSYSRTQASVAEQLDFTAAVRLTNWVSLSLGYQFYYWSNIVRATDQIDTAVDPRLLSPLRPIPPPAPTRPAFTFRDTDFWMQGLTVGLQMEF